MTRAIARRIAVAFGLFLLAACGATRPAPPPVVQPPPAPVIPIERKASWILRLEQERVLQDDTVGADLVALARDSDAGVRRRAAVAIGRIGLPAGVPVLTSSLADSDEGVRAEAAFALGLVGDASAVPALEAALTDASPRVRGRAAQGLGLVGASSATAAAAVANAAAPCAALIAAIAPDDEGTQSPEVEACRLSIVALVNLRQSDALLRVVLDAKGQPVSRWWPVAFALQRSADPRSSDALVALAATPGVYTAAFALKGLAGVKDARVIPLALQAAQQPNADVRLRIEAVRSLARFSSADAVTGLMKIAGGHQTPPNLMLESLGALAAIGDKRAFDLMLDLFTSPSPSVRAVAMTGAARMDQEGFLLALSSLDRDRDWSVRANLATVLSELPAEQALAAVQDLADDPDVRVQGPGLRALVKLTGPKADARLLQALQAPDFALRSTAAELAGERQLPGGAEALAKAYTRGESDATHVARVAAITALARFPADEARPTLTTALADRDWPVRLTAASLLRQPGQADAAPLRPAPLRQDRAFFESERLLRPVFTPHVYIETKAGLIQIELNLIEAPVTSLTFMELARAGFYDGLKAHRVIPNFVVHTGDPRGDGRGGPGYAIRDELSPLPFVRGTIAMAIDGRDAGGSQFFIALSPQPQFEGRYTVFGRVIDGWDALDRLEPWDVIDRVRVWEGTASAASKEKGGG